MGLVCIAQSLLLCRKEALLTLRLPYPDQRARNRISKHPLTCTWWARATMRARAIVHPGIKREGVSSGRNLGVLFAGTVKIALAEGSRSGRLGQAPRQQEGCSALRGLHRLGADRGMWGAVWRHRSPANDLHLENILFSFLFFPHTKRNPTTQEHVCRLIEWIRYRTPKIFLNGTASHLNVCLVVIFWFLKV